MKKWIKKTPVNGVDHKETKEMETRQKMIRKENTKKEKVKKEKIKKEKVNKGNTKIKVNVRKRKRPAKNKSKSKLNNQISIMIMIMSIVPVLLITTLIMRRANGIMEDTVGMYSEKLVGQINGKINAMVKSIRTLSGKLVMDQDTLKYIKRYENLEMMERVNAYQTVKTLVDSLYMSDDNFGGIVIYKNGEELFNQDNGQSKLFQKKVPNEIFLQSEFVNLLNQDTKFTYTWYQYDNPEADASQLFLGVNTGNNCLAIFYVKTNSYKDILNECSLDEDTVITIMDATGAVITTNNPEYENVENERKQVKYISTLEPITGNYMSDGHLIGYAKIDNGWTLMIDAKVSTLMKDFNQIWVLAVVIIVVILLLAVIISYFFAKRVVTPLSKITVCMSDIQNGNLNIIDKAKKEINIHNRETYLLLNGFLNLVQTLNDLIMNAKNVTMTVEKNALTLSTAADSTVKSASEVESAINSVAEGAQEQQIKINEIVDLIEKLTYQLAEIEKVAGRVEQASSKTKNISTSTGGQIAKLKNGVEQTITVGANISKLVQDLGEEVSNITNVLGIVKGINEQTNLLALNAAIEAARAGEAGKGFAVVADEVRKLSNQTQNAIQIIDNAVESVLSKKELTLNEVVKANDLFQLQGPIAEETSTTFQTILSSMELILSDVANMVQIISDIEKRNAQVRDCAGQIGEVVEHDASVSEEVSAESIIQTEHANSIQEMAEQLKISVEKLSKTYEDYIGVSSNDIT